MLVLRRHRSRKRRPREEELLRRGQAVLPGPLAQRLLLAPVCGHRLHLGRNHQDRDHQRLRPRPTFLAIRRLSTLLGVQCRRVAVLLRQQALLVPVAQLLRPVVASEGVGELAEAALQPVLLLPLPQLAKLGQDQRGLRREQLLRQRAPCRSAAPLLLQRQF